MTAEILRSLADEAVWFALEGVRTALPGVIKAVNKNTVDVLPAIKKVYADGTEEDHPVLTDVPVVFPSSSTGGVHFPLSKGDDCILVFSARSTDEWRASGRGAVVRPKDPRKFDLSDAVAYPLAKTWPTGLSPTDSALLCKAYGLTITPQGKASLKTAGSTDLIQVLDALVDTLANATVITGIGLQPFGPATIAALQQLKAKTVQAVVS
jgi:hypothetical protein